MMHTHDDRPIELRKPKTIEETLAAIAYKEQVAEHIDVQIVMMTEQMQDICQRVIALEAAHYGR
jgi:hypothetical protein